MSGDHDPVVGDVQQPIDRSHGDALTGQVPADVVAVLQDADPSGSVHPSADCVTWLSRVGLQADLRIDHLDGLPLHELGAPGGRNVADRLVLPL